MSTQRRQRPRPLTRPQYARLLEAIRDLLREGREREEQAVGQERVRTYHAVGQRLLEERQEGLAGYGTATLQRLADDVELDVRVLQQAVAFAQAYPKGPPKGGLRWTHYRELLRLTDPEQRGWYERRAVELGWSARKLVQAIRNELFRSRQPEIERSVRGSKPRQALPRPSEQIYVYKATIDRVVDGDTLIAFVDLGFRVLKQQRLRLAGIDTPARGTKKGDRAMRFVERELAQVDFVVLSTDQIDLYGRYVAHVLYLSGEKREHRVLADGHYLNQRLVDEGLATVF